jgi:hypothetical protein
VFELAPIELSASELGAVELVALEVSAPASATPEPAASAPSTADLATPESALPERATLAPTAICHAGNVTVLSFCGAFITWYSTTSQRRNAESVSISERRRSNHALTRSFGGGATGSKDCPPPCNRTRWVNKSPTK